MEVFEAFGSCPRCGHGIDYRNEITVCSDCGWMPEKKQDTLKFKKHFLALGIVGFLAFVQMINWGSYSLEIIPLKTKSVFGLASTAEYDRLAKICEEQLKYECAAGALGDKAWQTENAQDFKLLGDLRRRMGDWDNAIEAYELSLSKVTNSQIENPVKGDIYYGLAKSFHEAGQLDMAEDYYKKSIKAKPDVLQVTVTIDYARLLKNAGRDKDAKRVIASAERKSGAKGRFDSLVDL